MVLGHHGIVEVLLKEKTGSYLNNQLDKRWTFWSEDGTKNKSSYLQQWNEKWTLYEME